MMKKKRIYIYVIMMVMTMNLCGCAVGGTDESTINETEENTINRTNENIISGRGENVIMADLNHKSFAEIAAVLEKYGVSGITDEQIEQLEAAVKLMPEGVIYDKTAMLLTEAGSGVINFDTWEWTPTENGVYSFDVEVFDLDNMYTNFLLGVSAIGEGELDFKNITEDTSGVDWENGTGKRTVSFEWNGSTYTLEAKFEHDWFDADILAGLNKIIIENGNGKRLYFTGDGYQECIVFYRDAEWADAFGKETGLSLSER